MTAGEALQQLIGAEVTSVSGTPADDTDPDECFDFRIVTNKGALIACATNNGAISLEWSEWNPYPKSQQLARGQRRYRRKVRLCIEIAKLLPDPAVASVVVTGLNGEPKLNVTAPAGIALNALEDYVSAYIEVLRGEL